jgi:hypothetical protein
MAQVDQFDVADRIKEISYDIKKSIEREKLEGGWKGNGMAEMERLDGIVCKVRGVGTVAASGVKRKLRPTPLIAGYTRELGTAELNLCTILTI